jgi:hypothetical protein
VEGWRGAAGCTSRGAARDVSETILGLSRRRTVSVVVVRTGGAWCIAGRGVVDVHNGSLIL